MSEEHTPPATGFGTEPANPGSAGAALYPDGGGAGGAASAPLAPVGDGGGGSGTDTSSSPAGADTSTGTDTSSGTDTTSGMDTTSGQDTTSGSDTSTGTDSLSPESYSLTLPDTFTADADLLNSAATLFAEIGVPVDQAQKLVDFYVKASTDVNAKATTEFNAEQQQWKTEIDAMPEFQGEARATSLQAIAKVFDEYGTPEAKAALEKFSTGNNPALAKMFLRMANALSEGTPTTQGRPAPTGKDGRPASTTGKTIGQRLYPDQAQSS